MYGSDGHGKLSRCPQRTSYLQKGYLGVELKRKRNVGNGFSNLHTVLLTLCLKVLLAFVDVKLAYCLSHMYLKSPVWTSEADFFKIYYAILQSVCVSHCHEHDSCELWHSLHQKWYRYCPAIIWHTSPKTVMHSSVNFPWLAEMQCIEKKADKT